MVGAMGASGFVAFDFMICHETGDAYLLECNPRPNQINHLGCQIGANLCDALSAALHNRPVAVSSTLSDKVIPLFPQQWLQNEQTALGEVSKLDIPRNDPKLFNFMLQHGSKRGVSGENLMAALQSSGADCSNYTYV